MTKGNMRPECPVNIPWPMQQARLRLWSVFGAHVQVEAKREKLRRMLDFVVSERNACICAFVIGCREWQRAEESGSLAGRE